MTLFYFKSALNDSNNENAYEISGVVFVSRLFTLFVLY
jgi:hypothetical protein